MTARFPATPRANAWWRTKTRRERALIGGLAAVAALGLLWMVAWRPLAADSERLDRERDRREHALLEARRDAQDVSRLARSALPPAVDASSALERSLTQARLRDAVTDLSWQGRRARVTLADAPFATVIAWLEALQREVGLRLVEATISALVEPGRVRAELVLGP